MASLKRDVKKSGKVAYRIQFTIKGQKPKVEIYYPNQDATPKQQEKEVQKYAMETEYKLTRCATCIIKAV